MSAESPDLPPIDEDARRRFELAWRQGPPEPIEQFLPPAEHPQYLAKLEELVLVELEFAWKPGAGPAIETLAPDQAPARVEDYLRRFPRLGEPAVIRRLLERERRVRHAGGERPLDDEYRRRFPDLPETLGPADTGPAAPPAAPPLPHVPGYEVQGLLGKGGMGVVYKARHLRLDRVVALKMIRAAGQAEAEERERFGREARAVARLQHPHVVQIYEVGEHQGRPYLALEYLDGGSLAQHPAGAARPPREAARLVETVARAVSALHQAGIVHRDLKPANVLLAADGTPKVGDFGLAKRVDGTAGQTASGAVLGTPNYMAPEQAQGKVKEVGPAADVYALGAILYELLTGRPPFVADNAVDVLLQVVRDEPVPPSRLTARVPRDLETVCLKCLEKDPAGRYVSALALAQDLERFGAGEPILARREGPGRKLWRKVRRNPVPVASAAVVLIALVVAAVLAVGGRDARRAASLQSAVEAELGAEGWTTERFERLDGLIAELEEIDSAKAEQARGRLAGRLTASLRGILRQSRLGPEDERRFREGLKILAERAPAEVAALRLALRQRQGAWQTAFELTGTFAGLADVFAPADVRQEGDHLAVGRPAEKDKPADPVVLTTVPCQGHVQLEAHFDASWAKADKLGLLLNVSRGHTGVVRMLAFAPDGRTVATSSLDGTVRLWDVATGVERHTLRAGGEVFSVAFNDDGRQVLAGAAGRVATWDVRTGKAGPLLKADHGRVLGLAVSPDGKWLATGGEDHTIKLWYAHTRAERATFRGHTGPVQQIIFSRYGRTLLSAGRDGTVRFWDVAHRSARPLAVRHSGPLWSLALARDGRTLATATDDEVLLWDAEALTKRGAVPRPWPNTNCYLAFTADGKTLGVCNSLWDVTTRQQRPDGWLNWESRCTAAGFTPDGTRMATAFEDGAIVLWDVKTGRALRTLGGRGYAFVLAGPPPPAADEVAGPAPSRKPARPLASTLGAVQKAGGSLRLLIQRDGATQREQAVQVPAGPLRLRASREGSRLTVQVNDQEPLVFLDAFPLHEGQTGAYGLHWPGRAGLTFLRGQRQALASRLSPLERADQVYGTGHYAEALPAYQEQGVAAESAAARQEARYKAALCLLHLNRPDEARPVLEQVAGAAGERWPLAATCRLWLLHLDHDRPEEAEAVFTALTARTRFEDLLPILPAGTVQEILKHYRYNFASVMLFRPAQLVAYAERSQAALHFLQAPVFVRADQRLRLIQAYWLSNDPDRALRAARAGLAEFKGVPADQSWAVEVMLTRCCWLLRLRGEAAGARRELDDWLYGAPGVYRPTFSTRSRTKLLLERARLDAALNDWDQADKDLAEGLRLNRSDSRQDYHSHAYAHLMQGFLHERRGNPAAAQAAWRQGSFKAFLRAGGHAMHQFEGLPNLILGSLTGALTDAEVDEVWQVIRGILEGGGQSVMARLMPLPASALRNMWRTPRGRDSARQMAFRTLPFRDYKLAPMKLLALEMIRAGAFPGDLSPAQDALLWKMIDEGSDPSAQGTASKTQSLQLLLAWRGSAGALGWGAAARVLPPAQRGPLAYVMGHRYLRLKRPKDAAVFFRTALADAPANSPLKKLAQAELDRLKDGP